MKRYFVIIFILLISFQLSALDFTFFDFTNPRDFTKAFYNYTVEEFNGSQSKGSIQLFSGGNIIDAQISDDNRSINVIVEYDMKSNKPIKFTVKDENGNIGSNGRLLGIVNDEDEIDNRYDMVYKRPNDIRTAAGSFTVTEKGYRGYRKKKESKDNLIIITETTDIITVYIYNGMSIKVLKTTEKKVYTINSSLGNNQSPVLISSDSKTTDIELISYSDIYNRTENSEGDRKTNSKGEKSNYYKNKQDIKLIRNNNTINVEFYNHIKDCNIKATVYNVSGGKVITSYFRSNNIHFNISKFKKGIYFIVIESENHRYKCKFTYIK
ncbi:T9SS type A sorting domain-containing protein [candidate division WOR-3 bacterium]|jgi:hypothetical protein|nr:T9SS type A sorting domain-containing protein [candidate division WOR-3 bacterium]